MSVIRGTTLTTPISRSAVPDDTAISKKPWSSKNTVDKLCPAFTESGATVACEPVEGYPLEVVSHINGSASGVTLQHFQGGVDVDSGDSFTAYIRMASSEWRNSGDSWSVRVPCKPNTTYHISHLNPAETIFRAACVESFADPSAIVPVFNAVETKTSSALTVTTTQNAVGLIIQLAAASQEVTRKTLVVYEGTRTEHHADFGKTVTGGEYNWSSGVLTDENGNTISFEPKTIAVLDGKNGFKSDCGNTTVSCRLDPNKHWAEKLADQEAELAKFNKQYELIEERTINAETNQIVFDKDLSEVPYDFSAVRIFTSIPACGGSGTNHQLIYQIGAVGDKWHFYWSIRDGIKAAEAMDTTFVSRNDHGFTDFRATTIGTGKGSTFSTLYSGPNLLVKPWKNATKITLSLSPTSLVFPVGTVVKIYAIRG